MFLNNNTASCQLNELRTDEEIHPSLQKASAETRLSGNTVKNATSVMKRVDESRAARGEKVAGRRRRSDCSSVIAGYGKTPIWSDFMHPAPLFNLRSLFVLQKKKGV